MIDWQAIQAEYEQGISQRSLAAKYNLSQPAISQYAKSHGWLITRLITPQGDNLVDQALADLAHHLGGHPEKAKLELKEHKLFADAFSQYMKVKVLFPQEEESSGIYLDLRKLPAWKRMELRRLLAAGEPEGEAV
jgi:hypothetical protein